MNWWCPIVIALSFVAGYFISAMFMLSKNEQMEADNEFDWAPYDKPTVIRMREKEKRNDDRC